MLLFSELGIILFYFNMNNFIYIEICDVDIYRIKSSFKNVILI